MNKSDIEIAQSCSMKPISVIAEKLGLTKDDYELYGKYKAKLNVKPKKSFGKLILVTAITPTPAGEGKTTTTIGLADGLNLIGKKAVVALREPSLGPVFGLKGGAAGGGWTQVLPMEDINLHFTGDFHAISAANNLLAAMLDNHIYQGNALDIDLRKIVWKRCVDMNDRQLRYIVDGLNGSTNGVPHEDGFLITVASEIMAVLCLSESLEDLKARLSRIIVAYSKSGSPITCADLKAQGAMTTLLKDAIKPNLVQTIGGTPAFVHGGPFANIAHGCNSVIATKTALSYSDYCVTEAGFGADLGAEKFFDLKCRSANLKPDAVVMVATIRALKMHGGVLKENLAESNINALTLGVENLFKHTDNITNVYKLPVVVAINRFSTDTKEEIEALIDLCSKHGVKAFIADGWAKGGEGMIELAEEVVELCNKKSQFEFCYNPKDGVENSIRQIVKKIYGGADVELQPKAIKQLAEIKANGFNELPVCIAKTQYSLSDDPKKLNAPKDFTVSVKQLTVSAGAGFIVCLTGEIMTMPGLPKHPAAERIDIDKNGEIVGLF